MSTSAVGSVVDAIRAALILRSGLAGVNVFSGPVGFEEAGQECIAFGNMRLIEEAASMGGNRSESWAVDGELRVVKTWQGGTEPTIEAARDRALAVFAEVETHVNDTYTGALSDVGVTAGEIVQDYNPDGRICSLQFTLTVVAIKNP